MENLSPREKREWPDRQLFRVIIPRFPPHNIYRYQAMGTTALGPVMVATVASVQCGWWLNAEVIDENNYRSRRRAPRDKNQLPDHFVLQKERRADFVGISCGMSTSAPRALDLIRFYKSLPGNLRPKAIIAGGWHAMDSPQEFLQAGADVVVHGEAEPIIQKLLTTLSAGKPLDKIPGISYWSNGQIKRNDPAELQIPQEMMDQLPDPDFGLVRYAIIKIFPIGRTRGCSGKCRFCRVKSQPRWISPQRFLDQIVVLISKGFRRFFIVDDRSEEDLEGFAYWLRGVANFRKERNLRLDFTTQNRLSLAQYPEILERMRQAGVHTVAIGYESPIAEELQAMRKPINPDKILELTRVWKRFGFYVHMMLIFGYPLSPAVKQRLAGEGKPFTMSARQRAKIFWNFIRKANPDTLQLLLYTPLLGTVDREFLEKENRIYPLPWEFYDGTWLLFEPDEGVDPQELQVEMIKLMRKFYAFHYFWRIGWLSLFIHLLKIGLVTITLPFIWSFKPSSGFQIWHQVWRNAKRRFQGHLIISQWLKNFKRLGFIEKLSKLTKPNQFA